MHTDYGKFLSRIGCNEFSVETTPKRTLYRIQTVDDRREVLLRIQKELRGSTYVEKTHLSSVGCVRTDDQAIFLVKPVSGATENLHIKAAYLASGGDDESLDLFGYENVPCKTFNSWSGLAVSIKDELKTNKYVSKPIISTFNRYFSSFWDNPDIIRWDAGVFPSEKNELGKYLGELMIGLLAFRGLVPIVKDPVKFIVPTSTCFSGIDCAILQYDGTIVPISNKFGQGAKASFFTNLLQKIVAQKKNVKRSWALWNVLKAAELANYDERRAKEIVYNYGVHTVLGLNIEDPFGVYRTILNGKETSDSKRVISAIRKQKPSNSILSLLTPESGYSSITGYFTRRLSRDLNSCPGSIEFMKGLLAAKDFYQVHLNRSRWAKGQIEYSYTPSGNVSLTMMGDKASLSDITAKQGMVNYNLRMET